MDAKPGDLWLDSVELMPMLRVELPAQGAARPPRPGWIATRPVARWQFRAFVAAAPLVEREVQVRPAIASMDAARIADGDEGAPINHITFGEATLYSWYFGKTIAGARAWRGAEAAPGDALAMLGQPDFCEFSGYGLQEDQRTRRAAHSWNPEACEAADLVVDEMFQAADTGFRTAGDGSLSIDAHGNLPTFEPIALAGKFPR